MIYRVMVILGLLLMGSLSTSAQEAETTTLTPPMLEGTLWQLVSYLNAEGETVDAVPDTTTLELSGGEFGGNAGCNRYGGSYTLDGTTLELSSAISTLMACADEAVMAQETAYLPALASVASYAIVDDQLQLLDADDRVLMTFSAVQPAPLVGTNWVMTSYNNGEGGLVAALEGVEVTATFAEDGSLTGSAGCNSYNADYEANDGTISIGAAVSTRMACNEPEGVMEQETAYLTALEGAASYTIRGDVLELMNVDGSVLASYQAQVDIVGTTWWWQSYSTADGESTAVPNPENYVMTLVACPPESLSDAFLAHLAVVTTVDRMGESLLLSPGANGETLYFVAASGG